MLQAQRKQVTTDVNNTQRNNKTSIVIVSIIALCVVILVCILAFTKRPRMAEGVEIIEFNSIPQLYTVPEDVLAASENTLYKVGEDYYSYFPSTGKLELVSQVKDYDTMSLDVLGGMYEELDVQSASTSDDVVWVEDKIKEIETFGGGLDERTAYIEKELDNCNANLLLNADDADLLAYKTQLESELMKLIEYRVSLSEQLPVILAALETDEVSEVLATRLSAMMDTSFTEIVKTYNLVGIEDVTALERAVIAQQTAIDALNEKYSNIEETLINKRLSMEGVQELINTPEMQNVIASLDVRVQSYVDKCNAEVVELTTKVNALEKLYTTVTGYNDANYDTVLSEIQTQYNDLVSTQRSITERIKYLETVTSVNSNTSTDSTLSTLLTTELKAQQEQLNAIEDILNKTDLASIDKLAAEQANLRAYITELERTYKLMNETLTAEQMTALVDVKVGLETLITEGLTNANNQTNEKVIEYTKTLETNMAILDAETQAALNKVQELLATTDIDQTEALDAAVADLLAKLNSSVETQEAKLEEQRVALSNLVTTTTSQVQTDMLAALDESVVIQENKLNAEKAVLETLINTTNSDLHTELTTLMSDTNAETLAKVQQLDTETENQINDVITMLTDNSMSQETKLSNAVSTLETLIGTTNADTVSKVEQLDSETAQKIADVITALKNSSDSQDTKLTDAVATLQTMIDTTNADVVSKVNTLDIETTQKIADAVALLQSENSVQDGNLDTAIDTLEDLITTTSTATNTRVGELDNATTQKIADVITLLESETAAQEGNLNTAVAELQALVDTKHNSAVVLVEQLDTDTKAQINDVITLLETTSDTQNEKLNTAVTDLTTQLESSIAQQEAQLATDKSALETMITAKTEQVRTDLTSVVDTVDAETKEAISDVLTQLETVDTTQTASLNAAIADAQTALANSVTATENKIAEEKAILTALVVDGDETLKNTLTTAITNSETAISEETDTKIQNVLTLMEEGNDLQDTALSTAVNELQADLADSITQQETKLANEKAVLTTLVTTETSSVRNTLKSEITDVASDVTLLNADLNTVENNVSTLSTDLSTLNADMSALATTYSTFISTDYTKYTTETDTALANLKTAANTLTNDYNTYKATSGTRITEIEALLDVAEASIGTNTTNITTLNNGLATLEANSTANLNALRTETNTALATLETSVSNDYAAVVADINTLSASVTALDTLVATHDTAISTLQTDVTSLSTSITALNAEMTTLEMQVSDLETSVTDLETEMDSIYSLLDEKISVDDVQDAYVLQQASATELGGVKVDGTTITIDANGVISAVGGNNNAEGGVIYVGGPTVDDSIGVGSIWVDEADIPSALKPYCVQLLRCDDVPVLTYSTDTTTMYEYVYAGGCSAGSFNELVWHTNSDYEHTGSSPHTHSVTDTVTGTTTTTNCSISYSYTSTGRSSTITKYYVTLTYASGFKKSYTYAAKSDLGYYCVATTAYNSINMATPVTGTTSSSAFDTFMSNYGPSSGYTPPAETSYMYSNNINLVQRLKLFDNGCFGTTAESQRTSCLHQTASSGSTSYAVTSANNWSEAGQVYKLTQRYGVNTWIYVGTPS